MTGDLSLQEVVSKKDGLTEEYKKALKKDLIKKKKKSKVQVVEKIDDSAWGQLGNMVEYSREIISSA